MLVMTYSTPKELTVNNVYESIIEHGIERPKYVLAQSILETAWYSSHNCENRNNLFGFRSSIWKEEGNDRGYKVFNDWEESVRYYAEWQKRKGFVPGEDYVEFLARVGYAEDPEYGWKVKSVLRRLKSNYEI